VRRGECGSAGFEGMEDVDSREFSGRRGRSSTTLWNK